MTDKAVVPARRRGRRRKTAAHPAARAVQRRAKKVIASPWAERAARLGYVVRGIIYGTMGVLALGLAVGLDSGSTDQRGTLAPLGENPVGRLFLFVVVVSLFAYAGWGLIRAIYDPLHRGDDPSGIASRIGFAWSGLNYAALAVFATGLLFGGTKRGSGDGVQQIVGWALQLPAGGVIVTVAGVIGILGGLGQFADAYKAGFRGDLKRNQMTRAQRITVDGLGRFGMVARGVIFSVVGIFILIAGLHHEANDAHSFGPAFSALAREPLGHVLLAVVALGFVALGLHSWANARWVRMPQG
jgi:fumarate reductase subunit D